MVIMMGILYLKAPLSHHGVMTEEEKYMALIIQRQILGVLYIYGEVVQKYRGYVRRSEAPYYTGEIGYDKSYHYDENLLCDPPPFYPAVEYDNGSNEINISLQSIKQTSGD